MQFLSFLPFFWRDVINLVIWLFDFNQRYLRIEVQHHLLICSAHLSTLHTSCCLLRIHSSRNTLLPFVTLLPASIFHILTTLAFLLWPQPHVALCHSRFSRFQLIWYIILADVLVIISHLWQVIHCAHFNWNLLSSIVVILMEIT